MSVKRTKLPSGKTPRDYAKEVGGDLVEFRGKHAIVYIDEEEPNAEEVQRMAKLDAIIDELVPLVNSDDTVPRLRGLVRELIAFFLEEDQRSRERTKSYLNSLYQVALEEIAAPRRKGALEKLKNDPAQVAKEDARTLWPEAKRKGWTAERLHIELGRKGHTVKADTVRKWMTKLRKTGTC